MQILHESLERLLAGVTLCGIVTHVQSEETTKFTCLIEAATKVQWSHRWDLKCVMTPGGHAETYTVPVGVRWAGSVPVISAAHIDAPFAPNLSFQMMIHNGLFAGTWHDDERCGQVYGHLKPQESPPHGKKYVIERSGECMHDWWTGTDWSDEPNDAKWFDHEPCGPSETLDEAAHTVFYRNGKVGAG